MKLREYITFRINAIRQADTSEHDGIHRHESKEQRTSRIDELENLLNVIKADSTTGLK